MTEKKISTQIPVIFQKLEEFEKEDSRFLKVKIWLMHTGLNFNGSSFSKEAVEKAIPTLANTPILSFIEENLEGEQDFSDHRMVLHRSEDGDYNFKYLGSAVGVIPEVNNAHWEMRVTDSGEEKEYLVVDALMWTKWGDPTDIMVRKGITSQSMELSDQYTGTIDKDGVFHFETFSFFGACLLGTGISPAMQNSTVEVQFTENNALQKSIENKLQEFYTLFSQQGGTGMEDKTEVTEVEATEVVETFEETQVEESQVEQPVVETEVVEQESPTEEVFEVETTEATEATEAESTEEVVEEQPVEETEVVDYEAKYADSQFKLDQVELAYAQLQTELDELKSYKRTREEEDLQAKFADKLSDDEFAQVFTEMKDSELDKVEEKLFALIGKKNFSVSKPATTVNKLVLSMSKEEEKNTSPFDILFEKFKK